MTFAATNTDDFLIRMLKGVFILTLLLIISIRQFSTPSGCIQLSARPDINNTINMCPVDFVARLVSAAALNPTSSMSVVQSTSHPRLRFNEYLGMLQNFGYDVPKVWACSLPSVLDEAHNPDPAGGLHSLARIFRAIRCSKQ